MIRRKRSVSGMAVALGMHVITLAHIHRPATGDEWLTHGGDGLGRLARHDALLWRLHPQRHSSATLCHIIRSMLNRILSSSTCWGNWRQTGSQNIRARAVCTFVSSRACRSGHLDIALLVFGHLVCRVRFAAQLALGVASRLCRLAQRPLLAAS